MDLARKPISDIYSLTPHISHENTHVSSGSHQTSLSLGFRGEGVAGIVLHPVHIASRASYHPRGRVIRTSTLRTVPVGCDLREVDEYSRMYTEHLFFWEFAKS
jgi:hypothetical protein